jgi:hypothetical protein
MHNIKVAFSQHWQNSGFLQRRKGLIMKVLKEWFWSSRSWKLIIYCKSVTDLAWLSPLVSVFEGKILCCDNRQDDNYSRHPQLRNVDMTPYKFAVSVELLSLRDTIGHIKAHTFIRIVSEQCVFKSDDEIQEPNVNTYQYVFDTTSNDLPVRITSNDQAAVLLPEYFQS